MMASSASCLLDLKAELGKRRVEIKQTVIPSKLPDTKRNFDKDSKEKIKKTQPTAIGSIEEEQLKKSRSMLEAKAKMYERILSEEYSIDDNEEDTCLVNFSQKKKNNLKLHCNIMCDNTSSSSKHVGPTSDKPMIRVSDEWKIDEESVGSVHYQNVQCNEIRDHGVGYFAFSKTEAERQQQMKILNNLRQQAKKRQNFHLEKKEGKKIALDARLLKICRRRHIDETILKKDEKEIQSQESLSIASAVGTIPLPNDVAVHKSKNIRPWDIGKTPDLFQMKNEDYEKEKHWRDEEFAPPKLY